MEADFTVELGPPSEDATLEMPWDSGVTHGARYLDVKREPELLKFVAEAVQYPEMGEFLVAVNKPASLFESAKCDVWASDEITEDEDIYAAEWKIGSYVDMVFGENETEARFSFFRHEDVGRALVELLKKAPELPAAVEVIVRRCYYHQGTFGEGSTSDGANVREGFYFTVYIFGYGGDEAEARERWHVALQLAANAVLQLSAPARPQ